MKKDKEQLLKMVDDIQDATLGPEWETLTNQQARQLIHSLSSALGMAI